MQYMTDYSELLYSWLSRKACMFIVQPQKETFKYNVQCTTDTMYDRYSVQ